MERVIYERIQALEQDHWWFAGRRAILARLIGDHQWSCSSACMRS